MVENGVNGNNISAGGIRPVIVVDRESLRHYLTPLRHLLVGLADQSHPAMLICPPDSDAETMLGAPVEQVTYPLLKVPLLSIWSRRFVLDKLRKFKPTVIHCFTRKRMWLTRHLARELGIGFVLTEDTVRVPLLFSFIAGQNCGAIVSFSKSLCERLQGGRGRMAKLVRMVNVGTFVEDQCACFSGPEHVTSLVVAQRLDNSFEFELLLDAVRHLAIDGYEFILAIIGAGPAERVIHKTIKRLGLSQVVTVVPPMQPLRAIFSGADIFVCLEFAPGLNSNLLDAMSVGMAVAGSRANAGALLDDEKTAVLFDALDELSIYSRLQKLLGQRQFARQIAAAGQEHLRQNYTVSKMVNSLVEIYHRVQREHKENAGSKEKTPAEA